MASNTVLLERDGGVATVTLNRPEKMNSLDVSLMTELAHEDAAWGVVIPDMLHLTDGVQQVLSGHYEGVQTRILVVNFSLRSGGAGAASPA